MSDIGPYHHFDFEENAPQREEIPPPNSPRQAPTQDASHENPPTSLDLEMMRRIWMI